MKDRFDSCRRTSHDRVYGSRRRGHGSWNRPVHARKVPIVWLALASIGMFVGSSAAQSFETAPLVEQDMLDSGIPPASQYGAGNFFSQDLGTTLRVRYNTRSYGQNHEGNLDIGTFQAINYADSIIFFDGQVTLNDEQGVGFNTGLGYRWMAMTPYTFGAETVQGISLWADGTSTEEDNFFPQIGVSYESLGELWDLRANGYIPVGDDDQVGDFVPTGEVGFQSNFISQLTEAVVDQSFYAGELELARRLGHERDAWAFAGPYFLANDIDDAIGYEVGVRGYAYPDLLVQFAVSDDDIFATNATFSLVWFVGRTRTNFQPTCGVPDRMREPVMRNDYVVLAQGRATSGIPLTDPQGNDIRVVHVDSSAPDGGDGTFENPLNNLDDIESNSQTGDIVLAHAESSFNGQNAVLQDEQRFLGEGDNFTPTVVTAELGTIDIPETSPGARALARPMILDAIGAAVTVVDENEVANFDIDGNEITNNAIAAGPDGAGNPNLHDLEISDTLDDAITLFPLVRVADDGDETVAFNVTIDEVEFNSVGDSNTDSDIRLNAATTVDVTDANNTLLETIAITNVTSTDGEGRGLTLLNTHNGHTATISDYINTGASPDAKLHFEATGTNEFSGDVNITNATITGGTGYALDFATISADSAVVVDNLTYDGLTGAAGGIQFDNFDGTFDILNSDLTNGTLEGVAIRGASDGTFDFESTNTLMSVDGTSFLVDGGASDEFTGTVTVAHAITNDAGRAVQIQGLSAGADEPSVTFTGNITDSGVGTNTGQGMLITSNRGGSILFSGALDFDETENASIAVIDNNGTDISFGGVIDIDNTTTDAFIATTGGTLTVSNTGNSITTTTGKLVEITGMTISNAGVNFGELNRTATGATTNAVLLESNTGGPIVLGTLGDDAGESGEIDAGTVDSIVIRNSANATVSGLRINNTAAVDGVRVEKTTSGTQTVNLNDLEVNGGAFGVDVQGGTGTLNMTVNDTTINSATNTALSFNNVDSGTIQVNDATLDGNNVAGSAGVLLTGSNASFTFDDGTVIREMADTDFEVNGGTGTISMGGDIINSTAANAGDTSGRSVHIHDVSGGATTFSVTSSIDDDNEGMLITNNTGGTSTFMGDNNLNTGANDAVTITNNTGATISLSDLNIDTTTGDGLVATGGGTLTVIGTTNTIDTVDGVGLQIEDMTIGSAGVAFQSVNVTSGNTNAVILEDLSGPGQVSIGNSGAGADSGGTLTTDGTAIVIRNVQNVDVRNVRIANAGDDGLLIEHTSASTFAMDVTLDGLNIDATTNEGLDVNSDNDNTDFRLRLRDGDLEESVAMDVTGGGTFLLLVEDTDIDSTTAADAFALTFSDGARDGQITFRDNNDFAGASGRALFIDADTNVSNSINLLVEDSDFFSTSNAIAAVDIRSRDNTTLNATLEGNSFDAPGAANDFDMRTDSASGRIRLKLGDDDSSDMNTASGGAGTFIVRELSGDFDVFERDDTFADLLNNGTVNTDPNDAAFDNLPVAPPLPTLP